VDVIKGRVRAYSFDGGKLEQWDTPGQVHGTPEEPGYVGALGLESDRSILVALQDGLYSLDLASGAVTPRCLVPDCDPETRLNDGRMDRQGRYVCGQATRNGKPNAKLLRFNASGEVEELSSGYYVSNGICFSPEGDRMYFTDSFARKLLCFPYEPDGKFVGEASLFFDAKAHDTIGDGATVDSNGNVWSAMTKTGEIMKIDPAGNLLDRVPVPVEFPSCTAFGGEDYSTLFVTTIMDSKTGRTISKTPDECGVFSIKGYGARGIPEARFGSPKPNL
jgi:sugar lactone lactonase YvrE